MNRKTFQIGDTVYLLDAIALPKRQIVQKYGTIDNITIGHKGEELYWLSCCRMARSASVLRHADYRLPSGEVVRVDATAVKGEPITDFTLADGSIVKATIVL